MTARKKSPAPRVNAGTSKEAARARKRLFVEAFFANGENQTKAAISIGCPEAGARTAAYRMMKDAEVVVLIEQRRSELASRYAVTTENVIRSLSQALFFDPRKLYREDGTLKDVKDLDEDTAAVVSAFEVTEETVGKAGNKKGRDVLRSRTAKVKWLDKGLARDQAMKHLGLYKADNIQRTPLDGLPRETLKAIVERLGGRA